MRKVEARCGPLLAHAKLAQERAMAAIVEASVAAEEGEETSPKMRLECHRTLPAIDDQREENACASRLWITQGNREEVLDKPTVRTNLE